MPLDCCATKGILSVSNIKPSCAIRLLSRRQGIAWARLAEVGRQECDPSAMVAIVAGSHPVLLEPDNIRFVSNVFMGQIMSICSADNRDIV